jgi:transcriptional regulator GlxA family with amidase domain
MARANYSGQGLADLAEHAGYQAEAFAALCNLSGRQLRRRFQAAVGCSPQRWLDRQRVIKVQEKLLEGFSVKAIAIDMGFKYSSHLSRQFKAFTGMTCLQFVALNLSPPKCPPPL